MEIIHNIPSRLLKPCVATVGFFDGVHRGHRFLIDRVKEIASAKGYQSAVITFSIPPRQIMNPLYKPQLLTTYSEKMDLLADTGIDECMALNFSKELSNYSALQFMTDILSIRYNVRHLIVGYDHRFGHNRSEGFEDYVHYGQGIGIEVERMPAFLWDNKPISSSAIRQLLSEGEVAAASEALSYTYFLNGTVTSGHQVGRQIGFPTANVAVEGDDKLIPEGGVYAVKVRVGEKEYKGMLNIGHRPTLNNGNDLSIEVHILNFDTDIYNCPIRISFIRRIRSEHKFDNVNALKVQLQKDKQAVEQFLDAH